MANSKHPITDCLYLVTWLLAVAALGVVVTLHVMAWFPFGVEEEIFEHVMGSTWSFYDLDIVEPDWLFYIWMAMYGLQVIWLIYGLFAVRPITKLGSLVSDPPIMPSSIYYAFILALAGTLGWLVLWDMRLYAAYSIICIAASTVFLCLATAFSLHAVRVYEMEVCAHGLVGDVSSIRLFVQNGLAAYLAWTSVIGFYTMAIILSEISNLVPKLTAEYIVLGLLMGYIVIWAALDIFWSKLLTAHLYAPYLIATLAFIQPIYRGFEEKQTLFYINIAFLIATVCLLLLKTVIVVARAYNAGPLSPPDEFGAVEYKEDGSDDTSHGTSDVAGTSDGDNRDQESYHNGITGYENEAMLAVEERD